MPTIAFDTGLFFIVAYEVNGSCLLNVQQSNPGLVTLFATGSQAQWNVTYGVLFDASGNAVTSASVAPAFSVVKVSIGPTSESAQVTLDLSKLSNVQPLLQTFVGGGSAVLSIDLGTNLGAANLTIQLRALLTASFCFGGSTIANHVNHAGVVDPPQGNLTLPASDPLTNYSFAVAKTFDNTYMPVQSVYTQFVTATSTGDLQFAPTGGLPNGALQSPQPSTSPIPPTDPDCRNLQLRIYHSGYGKASILPIDVFVPTDLITLIDGSAAMAAQRNVGMETGWQAATEIVNLLSELYADLVPALSSPGTTETARNRISLGTFSSNGTSLTLAVPALAAASTKPVFSSSVPGGHSAIGQALAATVAKFTPSTWRRRCILVLTTGLDDVGSPNLTGLNSTNFPSPTDDASKGIFLYYASFAPKGGENMTLTGLVGTHQGLMYSTAADKAPATADGLRTLLLNFLTNFLPVDLVPPNTPTTIALESGIDRAVFVSTQGSTGALVLTNGLVSTTASGTTDTLSWASADFPPAGKWTVQSPNQGLTVRGIVDLALRMETEMAPDHIGAPIPLAATIAYQGIPVGGAQVRVGFSRPAESIGALLTSFVQGGGFVRALHQGTIDRDLFCRLTGTCECDGCSCDARAKLLHAVEYDRNLPLVHEQDRLVLQELPAGFYQASFSLTPNEDVYSFDILATGTTPDGFPFAREHRTTVMLAPEPDPDQTIAWFDPYGTSGSGTAWVATALIKTPQGTPIGPGLNGYVALDYATPSGPVTTNDNLDGTYSVVVTSADNHPPSLLVRHFSGVAGGVAVPWVVTPSTVHQLTVTLKEVQFSGALFPPPIFPGLLFFDVVVAPNSNPLRAVRRTLFAAFTGGPGILTASSLTALVFNQGLESGATLNAAIGPPGFDYISALSGAASDTVSVVDLTLSQDDFPISGQPQRQWNGHFSLGKGPYVTY